MEQLSKYVKPTVKGDSDIQVGKPYEVLEYKSKKGQHGEPIEVFRIKDDKGNHFEVRSIKYEGFYKSMATFMGLDMSGHFGWVYCNEDGSNLKTN